MPKNSVIMDLADQIQRIGTNRRTGTLVVTGDGGKAKYIYFDGGRIQMVSIPRKKYLLGEALFKIGRIDRNELLKVIRESANKKGVLGTLLLDKECITREILVEAMSFQLQEEICDLFVWDSMHFRFEEGEPDSSLFSDELLQSKVSLNTEMLVIEAARRIDEWERIKNVIPSMDDIYRTTAQDPSEQEMERSDKMVYANVNGINDVEDILERTRLDRYAALQALARVKTAGLIEALDGNELVFVAGTKKFTDVRRKLDLLARASELGMDIPEGFLELAHTYTELKDHDNAFRTYMDYGRAAKREKDYENACTGFSKAVEIKPEMMDAYEELASCLLSLERKEEAADVCIKAAEHLVENGEKDKALVFWQKALKADEQNIHGRVGLGEYYENKGEPAQANIEFGQAADILLSQDKKGEAVGLFRHMLRVDSDCMEAALHLAETLGEMGKTEEAVEEYQKLADSLSQAGVIGDSMNWAFLIKVYENIVDLAPENRGAREWLASAYQEKGDKDKAIHHYEELAALYRTAGKSSELERVLGQLAALKPSDLEIRLELAGLKVSPGRREEAVEILAEGGGYLLKQGDKEGARRLFEAVLEIDPFDVRVHKGIVSVLVREYNMSEAGRYLTRIGGLCRAAGKTAKAVQAYSTAYEMDQENITPLRELSEMFLESDDTGIPPDIIEKYVSAQTDRLNFGDAVETCEKLVNRFPGNKEYKEDLEKLRARLDALGVSAHKKKGTDAPEESTGTPGSETKPAAKPEQKQKQEPESEFDSKEDLEETIEALKHVLRHSNDNTEAREKLAVLYRDSGRIREAIHLFDELAALYRKAQDAGSAKEAARKSAALREQHGISGRRRKVKRRGDKKKSVENKLFKDIPMSIEDFEKGFQE